MLATDRKLPLSGGGEKRSYVRAMFTAIAPRYDFLNHLLSLNIDRRWRRQAVARLGWERQPTGRYLDLCAGTLDLAAILATEPGFQGQVIGADFVLPMLSLGRGKADRVRPVNADAMELPFATARFDGATVGFGIRNLADLDAGLAEIARVLRPGGRLVILEFTTPKRQPLRGLYLFYLQRLLPRIGRLISRHGDAYDYLPASVLAFPDPDELSQRLAGHGFGQVHYTLLFGGICAIHVGTRD
ncbi:MAG TPA: ubiquinone/menaquinone biosynthesis methyltransferase, partial [Gemmatimonadales bacterium]|nr:ubiquinone/menaquinone biosynthesis methyltransferase [Gemmatimonadales bacterium]